jgi:hypothetical protein
MKPKHKSEIDIWLAKREAAMLSDKVSYEMNPVAWHLEKELGVPADQITHSDCCYFVSKVGGEYLRKRLRGVGVTIAARMCKSAAEHLEGVTPRPL